VFKQLGYHRILKRQDGNRWKAADADWSTIWGTITASNITVSGTLYRVDRCLWTTAYHRIPQRQDGDRWKAVDADRIEQYHYGTIATTSIQYPDGSVQTTALHRLLVNSSHSRHPCRMCAAKMVSGNRSDSHQEGDSALNGCNQHYGKLYLPTSLWEPSDCRTTPSCHKQHIRKSEFTKFNVSTTQVPGSSVIYDLSYKS
jgi:predicted cupin superfamily sugar epimerase